MVDYQRTVITRNLQLQCRKLVIEDLDKTLIYQAIENPAMRKEISIEELEKIQQSYPYFSTAHVLLAKMYQEKNDHRFADQLQQAALYSNDRQVLYEYIKDSENSRFEIRDSENSKFEIRDSEDSRFEIRDSEDSELEIRDSELVDSSVELDVPELEDFELRISNFESRISNLESTIENRELRIENSELTTPIEEKLEQNSELTTPVVETLEQNPESRIPNSELVIENPEVIRAKDLDPMEANFIIEAVHSTIELEAEEEKGEAEKGEEDRGYVEEEKGEEEERAPVTYAEYMMAKARKMKGGEEKGYGYGEVEKGEGEVEDGKGELRGEESFEDRISSFESSARRIQKPSVVEVQKSIIDKFIQKQPKITPGKAAEYTNTQNLGKDSLEEDMTFVTETMAKLYAAQGKIDKAKKVYRQLIALHPEKSVYFAAQLKNLNQNKKI
jgi:tetratricopeptide (TPR) repeat protein